MIFKGSEKNGEVTNLYYELTWPLDWEQVISFVETIIRTDFGKGALQNISVGNQAGSVIIDITKDVLACKGHIRNTEYAEHERGYLTIAGRSSLMNAAMRISFWTNTNRCLIQVAKDQLLEKHGERAYDKYADSIEILGHINYNVNKDN